MTTSQAPSESPTTATVADDSTATETTAAAVDGPPAADFEMELSDGSTFALADAEKPVYMVFWAEW